MKKNKDKLFEMDEFNDWVIQSQKRSDLKYTLDLILDFNEELYTLALILDFNEELK